MANWLGGKLVSQVAASDLQQLVDDGALENQWLDFKGSAYEPVKHEEMLKDVAAFANADGGYILIGVKADKAGTATGFHTVADARQVAENMLKSCLQNITPRVADLEIGAVDAPGGAKVVIIRIPVSARRPHMYTLGGHTQFVRRHGTENRAMTMDEIRELTLGDQPLLALREIREMLREVLGSQGAASLERIQPADNALTLSSPPELRRLMDMRFSDFAQDEPYYRIRAVPSHPVPGLIDTDNPAIRELVEHPPRTRETGWVIYPAHHSRITEEGIEADRLRGTYHLRLMRNGYLEYSVRARGDTFQWGQSAQEAAAHPWLYCFAVCELPVNFARLLAKVTERAGVTQDYEIEHSYLRIKGFRLAAQPPGRFWYREQVSDPLDREDLRGHPVPVTIPFDPDRMAFALVAQIYNAFGYQRNMIPLFDADYHFDENAGPMERH